MEQNNYAVGEQRERDTKGWSDSEANKLRSFPPTHPFRTTTISVRTRNKKTVLLCTRYSRGVSVFWKGQNESKKVYFEVYYYSFGRERYIVESCLSQTVYWLSNPRKPLYTVANPVVRGLLDRKKRTKTESLAAHTAHPPR